MERVNNECPTVVVEKIYENRKNPKSGNKVLQLRWITQKVGGTNVLSQFFKNNNFADNRVAFQVMHEDIIKEIGLKEGMSINDVLDVPIRLTICEYSESEFRELYKKSTGKYAMFKPKKNPSTGEYLISQDGEYIYRGILITDVNTRDTYVNHVGSVVEEPDEVTITNNTLTI